MDPHESMEIYIPVEAEVKSVPLRILPNSVLRRMGLSLSDSERSRKLAESPEGIWICPAVLQKKGQKPAFPTGNGVIENMSSQMGREFLAGSGPFRMSFVSSNNTAYKVLKDTVSSEKKVAARTHSISLLPLGSAPRTCQDAIVIYHGCIYLFLRKPRQRETHELQPMSQSSIPTTSVVSSKGQKKRQSLQASLEPADKELQRKRLNVTLPQISPKQPKDLLTKTDHFTTDKELLNDNSPKKKHPACRVTNTENRKDVMHKGRGVSSFKTTHSVPQSTESLHNVHSHCHQDAKGEKAAEEAAGPEQVWFQPQGEQEEVTNNSSEIQDLGVKEAESTNQNNDMDSQIKIDCGEPDNIFDIVEQSSTQTWTRRESQGAPCVFKELAQEEMIARMKAKLRQDEAALNNLHSS